MKKYVILAIALVIILTLPMIYMGRQVQANTQVMLAVFGQAGVLPPYRPPVVIPQATGDLLNGQIGDYTQKAYEIQTHITNTTGQPVGYHVLVITGERVPKDDWIAEAQTHLDALNAHVVVLQAHQ